MLHKFEIDELHDVTGCICNRDVLFILKHLQVRSWIKRSDAIGNVEKTLMLLMKSSKAIQDQKWEPVINPQRCGLKRGTQG